MTYRSLTFSVLVAHIFLGGGVLFIAIALWFISAPTDSVNLRHVAGVVEATAAPKRDKEPSGSSSFSLVVRDSAGKSIPLHVVKHHVNADELRALVGHRVTALHHGGLVYELRSDRGILFTFSDTVPIVARKGTAFYWCGLASLAIGLLLLSAQSRNVEHHD
jgi:hypothetical protein